MSDNMNHVMIDLESLGVSPQAPIVALAAVYFDPDTSEIGQGLYNKIEWIHDQQERELDRATVAWWLEQSVEAQRELTDREGCVKLSRALDNLSRFVARDTRVWGNGATFDITMLEDAYRNHVKRSAPWGFRFVRDCRTIRELADPFVDWNSIPFEGEAHNALDDAIHQAKWTSAAWQALRG